MPNIITGGTDTGNVNQVRRTYGRKKMSFKSVAAGMAKKGGYSVERASAMLAAGTRKTMKKHGMSTKHGIPKDVFSKRTFKHGSGKLMGHDVMKKVGSMGMMGDKHMMDKESMSKMMRQMPK